MTLPLSSTQNDGSYFTSSLYAWLSEDAEGMEGIIAIPGPTGGPLPLVGADEKRMRALAGPAMAAAKARGSEATLVRFERVQEVMRVRP